MLIGEKIKLVRLHRGMTQKELGIMAGFNEKTADIRIAQYESSARTPKADMIERLAAALGVNPSFFNRLNFNIHLMMDIILFLIELDGIFDLKLTPYSDGTEERVNIHVDCKILDDFLVDWIKSKQDYSTWTLSTWETKKHEYVEWFLKWVNNIDERNDSACQN